MESKDHFQAGLPDITTETGQGRSSAPDGQEKDTDQTIANTTAQRTISRMIKTLYMTCLGIGCFATAWTIKSFDNSFDKMAADETEMELRRAHEDNTALMLLNREQHEQIEALKKELKRLEEMKNVKKKENQ